MPPSTRCHIEAKERKLRDHDSEIEISKGIMIRTAGASGISYIQIKSRMAKTAENMCISTPTKMIPRVR